jgi:hypothetical protein
MVLASSAFLWVVKATTNTNKKVQLCSFWDSRYYFTINEGRK